jgi:ribose transport system ATP-binding protein
LKNVAGVTKPRSVSLTLRAREILGIAGLIGTGRTETLRACFGLDRLAGGSVVLRGEREETGCPLPPCPPPYVGAYQVAAGRSASHSLANGVGLLSENRKEEGLMLNRDLADNLTLTRFAPVTRFGFISRRRQLECAEEWMRRLDVRAQGPAQTVSELSGGNQQKIALGRLLHHDARILLLDEPTRGIDVGSKAQIYKLMGELAAAGKAVIFVSSYLPELLGVCDTLGVMCRGVLSEVRPVNEWTEHAVIAAAIGAGDP